MKENNDSELFYDLYQDISQEQKSFNSNKVYDKNEKSISRKYINIIIYTKYRRKFNL